jgi:excinuclease UvrABC nuclease subunit
MSTSISKNNNHKSETIHLCDSSEIKIESSEEFFYLSEIQEEVHRFTINFHRDKKSKKLIS